MNKTEYKAEIEYNKAVVPKKSNIEDKSSSLLQKSEGIDMLDGSSEHSSSQNSLRNDVHITCGELAEQTRVPMITVNNWKIKLVTEKLELIKEQSHNQECSPFTMLGNI